MQLAGSQRHTLHPALHAHLHSLASACWAAHSPGNPALPSLFFPAADVAAIVDVYGKGNVSLVLFDAHYDATKVSWASPLDALLRSVQTAALRLVRLCGSPCVAPWAVSVFRAAGSSSHQPHCCWPPLLYLQVTFGGEYTQANSIMNLVKEGLVDGSNIIIVSGRVHETASH